MGKAALRAMVLALAPDLAERGIHLGTVQICGGIGSNERLMPANIAEKFWRLYCDRTQTELVY